MSAVTDEVAATSGSSVVTRRVALVAAELGVLVLALGVVTSFQRLFVGGDWWGRLALAAALAWLVPLVARRTGRRVALAVGAQAVAGVLVLGWTYARGTLWLGLPTPATLSALGEEVSASFSSFSELVAPVRATDGFLVVITVALWVIAVFADTAAIRFRAPVQAAVPYVSTFAAVGILARESGRLGAGVAVALALGVYAATQRALSAADRRWVAGRVARGTRALAGAAGGVVVAALLAGLLVGPRLPGGTEPVLDLRTLGRGDGPRTVVSPYVSVRSLLGERSDQVMFTVRSGAPAYWRLTALETYDASREIWTSRGSYQRTDGDLPDTMGPAVEGEPLDQEYRIEGLAREWLPAAYVPRRVESDTELSYNSVSSSLIVPGDGGGDAELTYAVRSELPDLAPLLRAGVRSGAVELDSAFMEPPRLAPAVAELLEQVVGGVEGDYARMLALQTWFREEFAYDDSVDYAGEDDALAAFVDARRGFCQQFSSAFALLARALGVPSRVAVGFTPGDPTLSPDGTVEYVVRGRHAHAWPEVHLAGVGWVPFEPTPQRGNPQAEEYTGVPPAQAAAPPDQAVSTTTTAPSTTSTPTTSPDAGSEVLDAAGAPEAGAGGDPGTSGSWVPALALVAIAALVLAAAVVVAARRRTGRPGVRSGRDARLAAAWHDAVRAVGLLGLHPDPAETPREFADRVDAAAGTTLLVPLSRIETRRRFGDGMPTEATCEAAHRQASEVVDHVRSVTTRRQRVGGRVGR